MQKCCKSNIIFVLYLFDIMSKIAAINCYIEFMAVVNYVKTITSDNLCHKE